MQLTIDAATLAHEAKNALTAAAAGNTITILQHVLLTAAPGKLTIEATDLDLSLRIVVDANVSAPGQAVVPAKKLSDIVASLSGEISIEATKDKHVELVGGKARLKIATLPVEEFPKLPTDAGDVVIEVPGPDLAKMIGRVLAATTEPDARYHLAGGLLEAKGDGLTLTTTDGHRAAHATHKLAAKHGECRILVAKGGLAALQKIAQDATIRVSESENFIRFECGDSILHVKKVTGAFPSVATLLTRVRPTEVQVDVAALATSIKRVSLLAKDGRGSGIRLRLTAGELALSGSSTDIGQADDSLPVEYSGEDFEFALNGGYALDFLAAAAEMKTITLGLSKPESEIAFATPLKDLHHYVMPMRL